mgnify:CR=1 FL=1
MLPDHWVTMLDIARKLNYEKLIEEYGKFVQLTPGWLLLFEGNEKN